MGDGRQGPAASPGHGQGLRVDIGEALRSREQPVQAEPAGWLEVEAKAVTLRETARQAPGGGDRHLLAENGSDRQLEAVPGAGRPKTRPLGKEGGEIRVLAQMRKNRFRVQGEVENPPHLGQDPGKDAEVRKPETGGQGVAPPGLDPDHSGDAPDRQRPHIGRSLDAFDTRYLPLGEEVQHTGPVVGRSIGEPEGDAVLQARLCAGAAAQAGGRPATGGPEGLVEAPQAAEAGGEGDL